jgi:hypothetical protein
MVGDRRTWAKLMTIHLFSDSVSERGCFLRDRVQNSVENPVTPGPPSCTPVLPPDPDVLRPIWRGMSAPGSGIFGQTKYAKDQSNGIGSA